MSEHRPVALGERVRAGRRPTHIAHRGYARDAAENTLPAVRAAVETADAVEVDVRRCADDLVVLHDATVDRVTHETGPVAEFTADELATFDVLGSGAGIPRFADVAAAVPPDVDLQVELKERGLVDDVVAAIAGAGRGAVLSSFDPAALREARDRAPEYPRALIVGSLPSRALETAVDLGCVAVHPHVALCLGSGVGVPWVGRVDLPQGVAEHVPSPLRTVGTRVRGAGARMRNRGGALLGRHAPRTDRIPGLDPLVGPALIGAAHDRDLAVNAWTVTHAGTARRLRAAGVDGLALDTHSAVQS